MTCATDLITYRNSDTRITYQFPSGTNLSGVLPNFFIRDEPGAFPILSIGTTPTVNGSSIIVVGDAIVLTIYALDLQDLPDEEEWNGYYDSILAANGIIARFVGGDLTQYADGSFASCSASGFVQVELNGQEVSVIIEGGNVSVLVSEYIDELLAAITSLTQSNLAIQHTGNGSQTVFDLPATVTAAKAGGLRVTVAGVLQYAGVGAASPDYTTNGTDEITFTTAPESGAIIRIVFTGLG